MPPSEGPFRVIYPEAVQAWLHELIVLLLRQGYTRRALASSLDRLNSRLRLDPMDCGEPQNRLPHTGLVVRTCFDGPFGMNFGVDEARRLVFVRRMFIVKGPRT
jgi:hypothetical protein